LTISGEKKFSEPGKKQLLNAHLHSLASNHCDNSRETKNQKKNNNTKTQNLCGNSLQRKKRKRRGKIGEAQRLSEGSSASGHPTSLFQISPRPFHLGAGWPEKKSAPSQPLKLSPTLASAPDHSPLSLLTAAMIPACNTWFVFADWSNTGRLVLRRRQTRGKQYHYLTTWRGVVVGGGGGAAAGVRGFLE